VTLGRLIGTRILVIFLSDFEVDAYPILLFLKYLIYPPDGEEPKERRLKAKNKHLKTVKEVYLSSLNEQQKQPLFDELKGKYEAEHGECGLIKDLNSGFILG
jgi:hypothetical protein